MGPARKPDDLDRMLDRLEEASSVVTAILRPRVTVTMSKRAFVININWAGVEIDYDAVTDSTSEEVQHLVVELGRHFGSDILPTSITIPRS
jgi:hypothetical protein